MTNAGGSAVPAGWYNDPAGSGHLRWWDGIAWSAHLAPQPAAAPVEVPAVETPANRYTASDIARPSQWYTGWGWFLAISPLYFAGFALIEILATINQLKSGGATPATSIVFGAALLLGALFLLVSASRDQLTLKRWGYIRPASAWWILLGPLVYLIIRTVKVYRETQKGIPLIVVFVIGSVVSGVAYAAVEVSLIPGLAVGAGLGLSSAQFSSSLQTGLNEKGGNYAVTCPPTLPSAIGSIFTCTAVDTSATSHALEIEIITGTNGKPTVKLLSVTPPIAG
jgi:Protein of unknown function (DUF2510)